MHLTIKDAGTLSILTLKGNLLQHHVDEMRGHLFRALHFTDRLIVNCDRLTAVAPTGLQVLCLAYRASQRLNKKFTLAGLRAEVYASTASRTDTIECINCDIRKDQGCLWDLPENTAA